jgi:hypothetical protein
MHLKTLISMLWLGGLGLQILLGGILLARRSWKRFPIFTAYCLFSLISDLGLYWLFKSGMGYSSYRYGYAVEQTATLLLGFGVVYEIFRKLFAPYVALRKMAKLFFQWGLVALILLDICVAYSHSAINATSITETTVVLQQVTYIVGVGLLLFLFLFATAFGLHWRQSVFGIALGLGILEAFQLIGITMLSHFGKVVMQAFNIMNVATFDLVLLVWMVYLLMPERVEAKTTIFKMPQLEQWNQALMELIHQ